MYGLALYGQDMLVHGGQLRPPELQDHVLRRDHGDVDHYIDDFGLGLQPNQRSAMALVCCTRNIAAVLLAAYFHIGRGSEHLNVRS